MIRKTLNASRLQQEVDRRIHRLQAIVEDGVKIAVKKVIAKKAVSAKVPAKKAPAKNALRQSVALLAPADTVEPSSELTT